MTCEVCGPLPDGHVHNTCHPTSTRRNGCGHPLDKRNDSLKCRICKAECGIDCTRNLARWNTPTRTPTLF